LINICLDKKKLIRLANNILLLENYFGMSLNFQKNFELFMNDILDINLQDHNGNTFLHWLCENEMEESIMKIIEKNIGDFNIQNNDGYTPLHMLCENEMEESVMKIIDKDIGDFNIQDNDGCTPLYRICENKMEESVIKIIDKNIGDFNIKNFKGETPSSLCSNEIKNILGIKNNNFSWFYNLFKK
jgi:ankyrin repeat protein